MPNINELLNITKAEISKLDSAEIFLLTDLYKGYEWNRISISDRLLLGTLFLNYVITDNIGVVPIEKTSSGQQRHLGAAGMEYISKEVAFQ
nr:single-stranded DNA-binding protein [Sedimentibacter sp.]